MRRKALALAMVAAMTLGLTACGNSGDTATTAAGTTAAGTTAAGTTAAGTTAAGTTAAGTTEKATEAEVTKPESIKFAINVGIKLEDGAMDWKDEYTKLTGINLEYDGPASSTSQYYQDLDLAYASDSAPDVFNIGDGRLITYAGQGALADLTDLFNNSDLKDKIDPAIMDSVTISGKIYGIPFEKGGGTITYLRQDWLDECNLKAPTNYEEFINVLKTFKEKYPDCIPMTAPALYKDSAYMYLREFYQDANPDFAYVDGKWVDGMQEENMVDALQRLQDAYADGLLDVQVLTNTTSICRDAWYAGKVGAFTYWAGTWAQNLETRLQANVDTAKVLQLPSIEETKYLQRVPAVTVINSKCDNIEGVFKYFLEYMHDGGEGQLLFESGVEGEHWQKEGTTLVQLPKLSKPEEVCEKAFISPFYRVTPLEEDLTIDYDERVNSSIDILEADKTQLTIQPASETYTQRSADLITLKDQTIGNIVTGAVTVEEGLANYKEQAASLEMDKIIEEMNAAN